MPCDYYHPHNIIITPQTTAKMAPRYRLSTWPSSTTVDDAPAVTMTSSFLEVGVGIAVVFLVVVVAVVLWLPRVEKDGGEKTGEREEETEEEEEEGNAAEATGRTCNVLTIVVARVVVMPGVQGAFAAPDTSEGHNVIS